MQSMVQRYQTQSGYFVYFVNTKRGNSFAVTFNVHVGSWHDDPKAFPGRAHLWEHVIHLGSAKFPGATRFDEEIEKIGADYNAYTSLNRTFYYGLVHESNLLPLVELLGETISRPEVAELDFRREQKVVMNEVLEYQRSNAEAVEAALWIKLLPENHPLKMFYLGNQLGLLSISRENLLSFYESNYQPEHSEIFIAGNFDLLSETQTRELLESVDVSFKNPEIRSADELAGEKRNYPSLFENRSTELPRWIELETADDQKILNIIFELGSAGLGASFENCEIAFELLNQEIEGSISDRLEKKGWITSISFSWQFVNELHLAQIHCECTGEGATHRQLLVREIFMGIQSFLRNPIKPDLFQFLKDSILNQLKEDLQHPRRAADIFGGYLGLVQNWETVLQWDRYENLSQDVYESFALSLFRPDRFLISYLGSDVKGKESLHDFERKFAFVQDQALISNLNQVLLSNGSQSDFSVELPNVSLPQKQTKIVSIETAKPKILETNQSKVCVLEKLSGSSTAAFLFSQKYPIQSVSEQMSLKIRVECFQDRFRSELGFLEAKTLFHDFSFSDSGIQWITKSDSKQAKATLVYLVEKWQSYEPTEEEVERAKDLLESEIEEAKQAFSAHIVQKEVLDSLVSSRFNDQLQLEALSSLTCEQINKDKTALSSGETYMGGAGAIDEAEILEFQKHLVKISSEPTSSLSRPAPFRSIEKRGRSVLFNFSESKEKDAFGICRVYQGPNIEHPNFIATYLLTQLLSYEVFRLNRTERELGYIHSTDFVVSRGQSMILFYGQTNGLSNLAKTVEGWNEIQAKYKNRNEDLEFVKKYQQGLIRNRAMSPHLDTEFLKRSYKAWLDFSDPNAFDRLTEQLKAFSLENKDHQKSWESALDALFGAPSAYWQLVGKHPEMPEEKIKETLNF